MMATRTKLSICRFRNKERQRRRRTDGIVLVIVMVVATLLLIALTAALPSVYQEGQREREEELIFRGTQYARAVALFHRQFNRYPVNVKELLGTNGIKFLRKEYLDPMDPKGKWRFIHVNASGVLLDSVNQRMGINQNNPAGIGGTNSSSTSSMSGGGFSLGGSSSMGFQLGGSSMGMNPPTGGSNQTGPTSSFFGNQNDIQGAYIAGVAATSHHESIKTWHKYTHYNEWEFIGLDMGVFGTQVGLPSSGPSGMGQQSPLSGPGFSPGPFGPTPPNPGQPPN
jgi:type II secretory pathway pseudopilin PulG